MSKIRVATNNGNESTELFAILEAQNKRWKDGTPATEVSETSGARHICLNTDTNSITTSKLEKEHISFNEFKDMFGYTMKSMLRTGFVVVRRDGAIRLVAEAYDGNVYIDDDSVYNSETKFNDDLTHCSNTNRDIVQIYGLATNPNFAASATTDSRKLLWDRDSVVSLGEKVNDIQECTLAQIRDLLGFEVKIIEE